MSSTSIYCMPQRFVWVSSDDGSSKCNNRFLENTVLDTVCTGKGRCSLTSQQILCLHIWNIKIRRLHVACLLSAVTVWVTFSWPLSQSESKRLDEDWGSGPNPPWTRPTLILPFEISSLLAASSHPSRPPTSIAGEENGVTGQTPLLTLQPLSD